MNEKGSVIKLNSMEILFCVLLNISAQYHQTTVTQFYTTVNMIKISDLMVPSKCWNMNKKTWWLPFINCIHKIAILIPVKCVLFHLLNKSTLFPVYCTHWSFTQMGFGLQSEDILYLKKKKENHWVKLIKIFSHILSTVAAV